MCQRLCVSRLAYLFLDRFKSSKGFYCFFGVHYYTDKLKLLVFSSLYIYGSTNLFFGSFSAISTWVWPVILLMMSLVYGNYYDGSLVGLSLILRANWVMPPRIVGE